jgi:hypothetical protein
VATYDFTKDPDAVLDYGFDWSQWLSPNEQIVTSTMIASSGINVNSSMNTISQTTVWLSGGTAGFPYTITNRITTNQGRTDDRTITIRVAQR